jgi:hypothetical protein
MQHPLPRPSSFFEGLAIFSFGGSRDARFQKFSTTLMPVRSIHH